MPRSFPTPFPPQPANPTSFLPTLRFPLPATSNLLPKRPPLAPLPPKVLPLGAFPYKPNKIRISPGQTSLQPKPGLIYLDVLAKVYPEDVSD